MKTSYRGFVRCLLCVGLIVAALPASVAVAVVELGDCVDNNNNEIPGDIHQDQRCKNYSPYGTACPGIPTVGTCTQGTIPNPQCSSCTHYKLLAENQTQKYGDCEQTSIANVTCKECNGTNGPVCAIVQAFRDQMCMDPCGCVGWFFAPSGSCVK